MSTLNPLSENISSFIFGNTKHELKRLFDIHNIYLRGTDWRTKADIVKALHRIPDNVLEPLLESWSDDRPLKRQKLAKQTAVEVLFRQV